MNSTPSSLVFWSSVLKIPSEHMLPPVSANPCKPDPAIPLACGLFLPRTQLVFSCSGCAEMCLIFSQEVMKDVGGISRGNKNHLERHLLQIRSLHVPPGKKKKKTLFLWQVVRGCFCNPGGFRGIQELKIRLVYLKISILYLWIPLFSWNLCYIIRCGPKF